MKELIEKHPADEVRKTFPPFFAVTADRQTAGRGRQGKRWESARGENLLLSLLLYPDIHPSKQFIICEYISIAALEVLRDAFSLIDVSVKWPNDIYVKHKKIAGILIEHFITGDAINYSIVGIGLNINQKAFPPSLSCTTSLSLETQRKYDVSTCMEILIEKVKQTVRLSDSLLKIRYEDSLYLKGEFAYFILPAVSGAPTLLKITGVDQTGRLQLVNKNDVPSSCAFNEIIYCSQRTMAGEDLE
jgi:BirA family biotin operon repressor/biotin-[acetyl-CoA-carboxylase] ligase